MWKLKLDENGNVVVDKDGNPVYIDNEGKEIGVDVNRMRQTITERNDEAKNHREAKEAAENALKAFGNIKPEDAKSAVEKLKSIDQSKLIDAGKLDEVKNEITQQYETKFQEQQKAYDELLGQHHGMIRSGAFSRSKFIADKIAVPIDMVEATFGKYFRVDESGKLRAYRGDKPIDSKANIGEPASFDEALEILVNEYPNKDNILKGTGSSGSGSNGVKDDAGKMKFTREEFNSKSPTEQATIARDAQAGKAVITD